MKTFSKVFLQNQRGTGVLVSILTLTLLLSFAGLDLGPISVIKAELQDAAHPDALAGSNALFNPSWQVNSRPHPGQTPLVLASYMPALYLDYFPGIRIRGQMWWVLCAVGEPAAAASHSHMAGASGDGQPGRGLSRSPWL